MAGLKQPRLPKAATRKPALQRGRITAGPLNVDIETDEAGCLHTVRLPEEIPDGLSSGHLSSVLNQLERHPLALSATRAFYRNVWQRLRQIPWGHALTYGEIAGALGSPRASRAVGQACGANPLPLIVPCHRVVATQGPGGFAFGPAWKNKFLELETEPRPPAA